MIQFNTKQLAISIFLYCIMKKRIDEVFEEYKRTYLTILLKCKKEKQKIILISDLNNQDNLPLKYVMKQAYFNHKIHKFNEAYVDLVCVYLNNSGFKRILDIYFSICPPCSPYKVCNSYEIINQFIKEKMNIDFDTHVYQQLESYIENIQVNKKYKELKNDFKSSNIEK